MIRIPFVFLPPQFIARFSKHFLVAGDVLRSFFPGLRMQIEAAELPITDREYLSVCAMSNTFMYGLFLVLSYMLFSKVQVEHPIVATFAVPFVLVVFMLFTQVNYPRSIVMKRIAAIDRNLLPAMQNFLVQLNSGVPIFNALVNLSKGDYGVLSDELGKAVREINAGLPEVVALEALAKKNPSAIFRGALWQIVNGMKTGADISNVIKEIINLITEQQSLQIQRYGATLNPLAMFYMLLAVIVPSLGMTFLVLIASLISFGEDMTKLLFWVLFGMVFFTQIMFMGIIRSKRPNLMEEG